MIIRKKSKKNFIKSCIMRNFAGKYKAHETIRIHTTFKTEEDCERYLREKREENGLKCTECGCEKMYWDKYNKKWICSKCGKEITLRSGTVMHGSKLPLMYWFTAIHLLTATKKTFSAKEIQRQLGHKRYQPIWEMVHKIRSVMGTRDSQYVLKDTFELDKEYFTTEAPTDDSEGLKRGIGSQRKAKGTCDG